MKAITLALLLTAMTSAADARVTRIEISKREPFAAGQAYGSSGAYEKIVGRYHGALDPSHPLNATIVDLDKISLSDPALDVGNFLAHIVWSGLHLAWPADLERSHALTFLSTYREEIAAALKTP